MCVGKWKGGTDGEHPGTGGPGPGSQTPWGRPPHPNLAVPRGAPGRAGLSLPLSLSLHPSYSEKTSSPRDQDRAFLPNKPDLRL